MSQIPNKEKKMRGKAERKKNSRTKARRPEVGSMDEDAARVAVHNAVMSGLEKSGIRYESNGESYWIDFNGGTLFIGIDRSEP